jgi:hypothetical protein
MLDALPDERRHEPARQHLGLVLGGLLILEEG